MFKSRLQMCLLYFAALNRKPLRHNLFQGNQHPKHVSRAGILP